MKGWLSKLFVVGWCVVFLTSCGSSRVVVSCLDHIQAGDMGRFVEQEGGLVLDPLTGAEWYRCALGQRYTDSGCVGQPRRLAWEEVPQMIAEIEEQTGVSWRLPLDEEFFAITRKDCINPVVNPNVFPNITIENHWVVGTGLSPREECMLYTYTGTRSCRVIQEMPLPVLMVKEHSR